MVNPSKKGGPGFVEPAVHLVCYTSRHCLFHLKASSAPCEDGCVGGNGDGYVGNVVSAVCVESAGRAGSAGSVVGDVRTHVRYDGDVGGVGAVCRDPPFHNELQTLGSHVAVDGNG